MDGFDWRFDKLRSYKSSLLDHNHYYIVQLVDKSDIKARKQKIVKKTISIFIKKNKLSIIGLKKTGRDNPDVIAVMMTEMYFRTTLYRVLEYVFYRLAIFMWLRRTESISLGLAQIQAKHWGEPISLSKTLSLSKSYDLLLSLWSKSEILEVPLQKKVAHHVGEARAYYMKVCEEIKTQVATL